jgi:hypothetical protein
MGWTNFTSDDSVIPDPKAIGFSCPFARRVGEFREHFLGFIEEVNLVRTEWSHTLLAGNSSVLSQSLSHCHHGV